MSLIPGVLYFVLKCSQFRAILQSETLLLLGVVHQSLSSKVHKKESRQARLLLSALQFFYKVHILDRNSCPGHLPWVSDGCPNLQPPGPRVAAALADVQCDAEVFCLFCFILHRPRGACGYRIIISCLLKKRIPTQVMHTELPHVTVQGIFPLVT